MIGLAVARSLTKVAGTSTVVLERHGAVGTETSSRNSEVIHAGLYYGKGSLKTDLCIAGKEQLYAYCAARGVPHRRTGKWVVAQTVGQRAALEDLAAFCRDETGVPVRWVGGAEAARREPAVRAEAGILESPSTGIVDSHALMTALTGEIADGAGEVALASEIVGVAPLGSDPPGSRGWEVRVRSRQPGSGEGEGEETTVVAEVLVNAAGLGAVDVHNMIVPEGGGGQRMRMFYAKGNYFSYAASRPRVGTLVYPAPEPGHGGLGTHLTLDMAGRMRFGPDVEWVDSPADLAVSAARLPDAVREIKRYLPSIDEAALQPDYAGIRPKLGRAGAVMSGKGFVDFVIRKEDGYEGWVNLLGIESPGLTSCLAIGDMVKRLLYS